MALTKVTYSMIQDAAVNVRDYGASSSATATANLAAFKLALAATPVNGTLFVPADSAEYVIDTNGGESNAITIDKQITVWIDGVIKSNFGAIQANPPTIFLVTANNVNFIGTGTIKGNGTINQVNAGTSATTPCLIKVTGNYFSMQDLTIDTPYKVGVFLSGSNNSRIVDCNFTGGPTAYEDTGYFGIYFYQGSGHIVSGNQFYPDADGGMYVQCVFTNGASKCIFDSNVAIKPYEKIFYINASDNVVTNNICYGNSGAVPGTNIVGTLSDAIRISGNRNKVTNNYLRYTNGISDATGGFGNDVSNNTLLDCGQGGISIYGGSTVIDYTTVCNNEIKCGNLANTLVQDGIYIQAPTGTNYFVKVTGNTVVGFSPSDPLANIDVWASTTVIPYIGITKPSVGNSRYYTTTGGGTTGGSEPTWPTTPGDTVVDGTVTWTCVAYSTGTTAQIRIVSDSAKISQSLISGNILSNGERGISSTYLDNSVVSNNTVDANVYPIYELTGTDNRYLNNVLSAPVGVVGVQGIDATSNGYGNIWQKTAISSVVTSTNAVNTFTYSGTLLTAASEALVQISPANATAAAFIAANGVYAVQSSPDIQISSGNGTNFTGNEDFIVMLIQ